MVGVERAIDLESETMGSIVSWATYQPCNQGQPTSLESQFPYVQNRDNDNNDKVPLTSMGCFEDQR